MSSTYTIMVTLSLSDSCKNLEEIQPILLDNLIRIVNINSHSSNIPGVELVVSVLLELFREHAPHLAPERIPLEKYKEILANGQMEQKVLADSLFFRDTRNIPQTRKLLFMIHLDTVFPPDSPFQRAVLENATLKGPGSADAKGGVMVILAVLSSLRHSPLFEKYTIDVFLNTDEEIGSPGSNGILQSMAKNYDYAFVFEPSLPDGSFISERKGNGNFYLKIAGKSAHAGREFHKGISAIHAASEFVFEANQYLNQTDGITFNTGKIDGGGPVNIVSDLAIVRYNLRVENPDSMLKTITFLQNQIALLEKKYGVRTESGGDFSSPPKVWTADMQYLFDKLKLACESLDVPYIVRSSGGVSDGNKLQAAGLSNIDTLGVMGNYIHSQDEFMLTDSLSSRPRLVLEILRFMAEEK